MAFSLEETQEDFIELLDDAMMQRLVEQAIPDIDTVKRVNGVIEPYIAYSFGQPREQGAKSFAGPWGDDYVLPIYLQVIAPTAKIARQLGNKLVRTVLGQGFGWTGQIRQMSGGPILPITQSSAATEAYMQPLSFGLLIQMHV